MDTLLFQQSQSIDEIKNRLNCIESGSCGDTSNNNIVSIKQALVSDPEFVNGIVDNIMNNSNLSEIIEQIDVVQTENRELRELLYAQQKTINEMNFMLLKMLAKTHSPVTAIVATNEAADEATNEAADEAADEATNEATNEAADEAAEADVPNGDAISLEISE